MTTLRLWEWSSVRVSSREWTSEKRRAVSAAAEAWRVSHRLNAAPLSWSGADGCTLNARQWVGIAEIEGARIEIYPKTDRALKFDSAPDASQRASTLRALLRLMEAGQYHNWIETSRAALDVASLEFADVWAYFLANHLWPELRRGLPHEYSHREDELPVLKGKVLMARQLNRFGLRPDKLACAWDEFSPDTPLLQLLKCACRFLSRKVSHPGARGLLNDCVFLLDDVSDFSPEDVLRRTERMTWTRGMERFRATFNLARRLLQQTGPQLGAGEDATWVFLVDMDKVFEAFCARAIEERFQTFVNTQHNLGHLISSPRRRLQRPDYIWSTPRARWIGDAKWKLLDKNASDVAGQISVGDLRQFGVYAELERGAHNKYAQLAVFYPAGAASFDGSTPAMLWNGARLHFVPVQLIDWQSSADSLPVSFRNPALS